MIPSAPIGRRWGEAFRGFPSPSKTWQLYIPCRCSWTTDNSDLKLTVTCNCIMWMQAPKAFRYGTTASYDLDCRSVSVWFDAAQFARPGDFLWRRSLESNGACQWHSIVVLLTLSLFFSSRSPWRWKNFGCSLRSIGEPKVNQLKFATNRKTHEGPVEATRNVVGLQTI